MRPRLAAVGNVIPPLAGLCDDRLYVLKLAFSGH